MGGFILFSFASSFLFSQVFSSPEQGNGVPIVDFKTGKELEILTHNYYAVQNQKTSRYLIWSLDHQGTIRGNPQPTDDRYWHIFEKSNQGWYEMAHHSSLHWVKITKSPEVGYYHIYNKDCSNGGNPNAEVDEHGTIMCHSAERGDLKFNWKFIAKAEEKNRKRRNTVIYVVLIVGVLGLGIVLIVVLKMSSSNFVSHGFNWFSARFTR